MDRETVVKLARISGLFIDNKSEPRIILFAELITKHTWRTMFKPDWVNYRRGVLDGAADEREACAKLCEADGLLWGQRYAAAIRARGEL